MAAPNLTPETLDGLDALRRRIFAGDNTHCFIERQRILNDIAPRIDALPEKGRYAHILEALLEGVSTPIEAEDIILGRMVEGPLPLGTEYMWGLPGFGSAGHLTADWPTLLQKGLAGIAAEARETAEALGTDEARRFAGNAGRCCAAIVAFAERYADAALAQAQEATGARREALQRAAQALRAAPAGPAPDFLAALQGIWIVHFVMSCIIGARDFALGRVDQYLLPLYEQGLADGTLTRKLALAYLAHFLMKTKEITGTATDTYLSKPVPCFASNQYVVIGGRAADGQDQANELSLLILEAATLVQMPQPEINVRLDRATSPALLRAVAEALPVCHHQIQFWNDEVLIPALMRFGIPADEAHGYALTACNRVNLPGMFDFSGGDIFHNMAHWLLVALAGGKDPVSGEVTVPGLPQPSDMPSIDGVLAAFTTAATQAIRATVRERSEWMRGDETAFHFESALLQDCVQRGRDTSHGGLRYGTQYHFFGGVATTANSLIAIRKLVFEQRRFKLPEFLQIVANDFADHADLRQEIVNAFSRYGNDDVEADEMARAVCDIALDALAAAPNPDGHLLFPSIYSLHCHIGWGRQLLATPDGRLAGEPISENQSPTHGTDRLGTTALLRSVARLPHERTPMGGLNVKLAFKPQPQTVLDLVASFFELGGIHVGFSFVDRETLLAAQVSPAEYRTLCVRITGFSEFFAALSPEGQQDVIARTEH